MRFWGKILDIRKYAFVKDSTDIMSGLALPTRSAK